MNGLSFCAVGLRHTKYIAVIAAEFTIFTAAAFGLDQAASPFPVIVDGAFTGSGLNGSGHFEFSPNSEWSDVTPVAFFSSTAPDSPVPVALNDPTANSFLYAAIAPGTASTHELYLLYDYTARTQQSFAPNEFIGSVSFPVNLTDIPGASLGFLPGSDITHVPISVQLTGASVATANLGANLSAVGNFFDVSVLINDPNYLGPNPISSQDLNSLGLGGLGETFAAFGPSPHADFDHLIIELEASLHIPANFSGPNGFFPEAGTSGIYSPDPAFWGSNIANDLLDPPATAAFFQINGDGSVTITTVTPEPSSIMLASLGLLAVARARRMGRR